MNEFNIDPREAELIMKQRALIFAKPQTYFQTPVNGTQIVTIKFEDEKYGIEVGYVKEIFPLRQLTQVPCTPSFVSGIINVRGKIVSTIDLRIFFGIPTTGITDLKKVVIIHHHDFEMGILAAEVLEVSSIPKDQIHTPTSLINNINPEYIKGLTSNMVTILDLEKIIEDGKLIVNQEIL